MSQVTRQSELPFQTVVEQGTGRLFRKSAQGFVVNERGLFLAGTPVGNGNENFLQTVQGGMERGECERQTLTREFEEEMGLHVGDQLSLVAEVVPRVTDIPDGEATGVLDDDRKDAARRPFRYLSKSWRKQGVAGQQLCPTLFFADSAVIRSCQLQPQDRSVRREFKSVSWATLGSLVERAPPAKRRVMEAVVPHVYEVARAFLAQYYPDACKSFERQAASLRIPDSTVADNAFTMNDKSTRAAAEKGSRKRARATD